MNITNNKRMFRFEALLPDGEIASLEYRWLKGSMVLMHTMIPAAARGSGIGAQLVAHVLEHARAHNLKIIVYCSYVQHYIDSHTGYTDLLASSTTNP